MNNNIEPYNLQLMLEHIERLNRSCTDNMHRLNQMMLEMKGIVSVVRPQVKKTGWYGEELKGEVVVNTIPYFDELVKGDDAVNEQPFDR